MQPKYFTFFLAILTFPTIGFANSITYSESYFNGIFRTFWIYDNDDDPIISRSYYRPDRNERDEVEDFIWYFNTNDEVEVLDEFKIFPYKSKLRVENVPFDLMGPEFTLDEYLPPAQRTGLQTRGYQVEGYLKVDLLSNLEKFELFDWMLEFEIVTNIHDARNQSITNRYNERIGWEFWIQCEPKPWVNAGDFGLSLDDSTLWYESYSYLTKPAPKDWYQIRIPSKEVVKKSDYEAHKKNCTNQLGFGNFDIKTFFQIKYWMRNTTGSGNLKAQFVGIRVREFIEPYN